MEPGSEPKVETSTNPSGGCLTQPEPDMDTPGSSMEESKLALVTGACGFVGGYMLETLLAAGSKVRATDLEGANRSLVESLGVEFIPCDLTMPETLAPVLEGVDRIFHPAALFDYLAPEEALQRVNAGGMRHLCEAALKADCQRMVCWSTAGVYGPPAPELVPVNETAPTRPSNAYERSKLAQEEVGREFVRDHDMQITYLRPTPIYGPRNAYGMATTIFAIAHGMAPFVPFGNENHFTSVHVRDVCGAAQHLCDHGGTQGDAYNLCDDGALTHAELVRFVAGVLNVPVYPLWAPDAMLRMVAPLLHRLAMGHARRIAPRRPVIDPDMIPYSMGDYWFSNAKLKETGYEFIYPDPRIGLMETMAWYETQGLV